MKEYCVHMLENTDTAILNL